MNNKQIWFSSDYHFFHNRVLEYDNRPFKDIYHMNETIINEHNNVVSNNDDFYFLGDFSFGSSKQTEESMSKLNGNKYFIKGNHDNKDVVKCYKRHGIYLDGYAEIKIDDLKICLSHYPLLTWNGAGRGNLMIHGHCHSHPNIMKLNESCKRLDAGIMTSYYLFGNWKPLNYETQILPIMNTKEFNKIDHH